MSFACFIPGLNLAPVHGSAAEIGCMWPGIRVVHFLIEKPFDAFRTFTAQTKDFEEWRRGDVCRRRPVIERRPPSTATK